jgi:exopolysaccharide biosynthesis polyprenyl glycosylphosphotransferase
VSVVPVRIDLVHEVLDTHTQELLLRRSAIPSRRRRGWLMRRMLLAADLLGLAVAYFAAEMLFRGAPYGDRYDAAVDSILFGVSLPFWVLMASLYGLYDRDEERADHSTPDDLQGVFHLVTVGTWLFYAGTYLTGLASPTLPKLLTFWTLAVVALPVARGFARSYCRRSVHYLQNTLIIGAGDVGQQVARKLLKHHEYGINLVGFVDAYPKERRSDLGHLTILGDLDAMPELVDALDVERVIVAFSLDTRQDLLKVIRDLNDLNVQVDIVPRFFEVMSPAVDMHSVEGVPLIGIRPPRLSRSSRVLKRVVDVTCSVGGLVVLAPLFAATAVAIKATSRGPVFYRQVRMGTGDRPFQIVKFRTMVADADARKSGLAHLNKHACAGGDPRMFKIDEDPRVTTVGRFLRRFSIDELPQLWNVAIGEMSLVGPRPLILDEDAHVDEWARRRLDIRPGITGLWQVLGRDDIPFEEMVKLDYLYVTSWSVGGDIRLLLKTLPCVFASPAQQRAPRGPFRWGTTHLRSGV